MKEERPARVYTTRTVIDDYFQGTIGMTSLREMIRKGKIPHFRVGSKILFSEESLNAWRVEQERERFTKNDYLQGGKLRAVR